MKFLGSILESNNTPAVACVLLTLFYCYVLMGGMGGCASTSSLSQLERMSRPIVVVAKTNYENERSIIVKDAKGKLLKVTETAFVHTYNPGDTLR